jgi:zinc transport system ATP-binding protein
LPPLDFEVARGRVCAIVGHNGSGKSTLLRTLLGLQPPLAGEVRFAAGTRLGYVPQREAMDPIYPIRVIDLVETGRFGFKGVGRRLARADWDTIRAAMESTGCLALRDRLFRTLSGGEQQRVLLARALCAEPTLLVLDEPTASMDERGAAETMRLTLDLARRSGAAILMVNHFIDLVAEISDQVVVLDQDHQRVRVGPPSECLAGRGRFGL